MCGIAGVIDLDRKRVEPRVLLAMSDAIAHRGPDDEGYVFIDPVASQCNDYSGPSSPAEVKNRKPMLSDSDSVERASIGLCHRRFSIIELSEAGHQPLFDRDRTCCVIFNGEIYNYLELRDELQRLGSRFATHSDTEVLLEAYKQWGQKCFSRFNGFWAIALFDFAKKSLILSRDRIGKKPLYWTRVGSKVYFASEIKALLRVSEVHQRRQINVQAVHHWLVYGRKDLDFTTFFEGIHSFPSGSWAVLDREFPNNINSFWKVPTERMAERDISPLQAATQLRELLEDSVRIRLRADVPVSVELSGGMDSSTLVALASQLHPSKVTTYTVKFPEKEWNEEPFASSVARRYNTDYRVLQSPTANFWNQILPFTYLEEEPYHSPNLQTNQVIWAQMRAMGTKVSLNGAAGDENFAGYGQYLTPAQMQNLREGHYGVYLNNILKYSAARTRVKVITEPFCRLITEALRNRVSASSITSGRMPSYFTGSDRFQSWSSPSTLSDALYSDMTNTLVPYWLRSGDRGYMGVPLEVRAPFLDYRVIEYAFRLPATYLIREGWHKWILRKTFENDLPKDVVWRRQKMGFPFPEERFFGENKDIIDFILTNAKNPYIDFSQRNRFRHNWKVISFILWYELFFNENIEFFKHIAELASHKCSVEDYGFTPQFLASEGQIR